MIIAYTAGGRTGNNLYHFYFLLAAALEYNFSLRLIDFAAYRNFDFSGAGKGVCSHHPLLSKFVRKMRRIPGIGTLGVRHLISRDDAEGTLTPKVAEIARGIGCMDCWPYIDRALLKKHQEAVRASVRPKEQYWKKAAAVIAGIRKGNAPVVGVHIRRTDYREWQNGKHFYDLSVYCRLMQQVSDLFNGNVSFIICSDEPQSEDRFQVPCQSLHISHEDFLTDFSLLAQCDYTMGPPSTFRMTSAFMGNTPSFAIGSATAELHSMNQFQVPLIAAH